MERFKYEASHDRSRYSDSTFVFENESNDSDWLAARLQHSQVIVSAFKVHLEEKYAQTLHGLNSDISNILDGDNSFHKNRNMIRRMIQRHLNRLCRDLVKVSESMVQSTFDHVQKESRRGSWHSKTKLGLQVPSLSDLCANFIDHLIEHKPGDSNVRLTQDTVPSTDSFLNESDSLKKVTQLESFIDGCYDFGLNVCSYLGSHVPSSSDRQNLELSKPRVYEAYENMVSLIFQLKEQAKASATGSTDCRAFCTPEADIDPTKMPKKGIISRISSESEPVEIFLDPIASAVHGQKLSPKQLEYRELSTFDDEVQPEAHKNKGTNISLQTLHGVKNYGRQYHQNAFLMSSSLCCSRIRHELLQIRAAASLLRNELTLDITRVSEQIRRVLHVYRSDVEINMVTVASNNTDTCSSCMLLLSKEIAAVSPNNLSTVCEKNERSDSHLETQCQNLERSVETEPSIALNCVRFGTIHSHLVELNEKWKRHPAWASAMEPSTKGRDETFSSPEVTMEHVTGAIQKDLSLQKIPSNSSPSACKKGREHDLMLCEWTFHALKQEI